MGVDPVLMGDEGVAREVAERLASGACGIKVAPMFIHRRPDDEVMEVVWRCARDHGVFVLSQSGASRKAGQEEAWGHPAYFDAVLAGVSDVSPCSSRTSASVPRMMWLRSPLGIQTWWPTPRCSSDAEPPDEIVAIIRRIGTDRVLFGTNYPLVDQSACVAIFEALPLTDEERHQIGYENASRLLTRH